MIGDNIALTFRGSAFLGEGDSVRVRELSRESGVPSLLVPALVRATTVFPAPLPLPRPRGGMLQLLVARVGTAVEELSREAPVAGIVERWRYKS